MNPIHQCIQKISHAKPFFVRTYGRMDKGYATNVYAPIHTHTFYLESILKRNKNETVLNPLFLPHGPYDDNFLIISCVLAQ